MPDCLVFIKLVLSCQVACLGGIELVGIELSVCMIVQWSFYLISLYRDSANKIQMYGMLGFRKWNLGKPL